MAASTSPQFLDTTDVFKQYFDGQTFDSWTYFEYRFKAFETETNSMFTRRNATTVQYANKDRKEPIPERFRYATVTFFCKHYGKPVKRGTGQRKIQKYLGLECPVFFTVAYRKDSLQVSKSFMCHKNHTLDAEKKQYLARKRRQTATEAEANEDIIHLDNPSFKSYIRNKFNKKVVTSDIGIRNLKVGKCEVADEISSEAVYEDVGVKEEHEDRYGRLDILENNTCDILSLGTDHRKQVCKQFPEILPILGTGKINKYICDEEVHPKQLSLYQYFTDNALKLMIDNHKTLNSCSLGTLSDSSYDVVVNGKIYTISICGNCTCQFNKQFNLPCVHAICLLGLDVLDVESLISKSSYLKTNSVPTMGSHSSSTEGVTRSRTPVVLTESMKFRKANELCQKINVILSRCSTEKFHQRMAQLQHILHSWEKGEEVFLVEAVGMGESAVDKDESEEINDVRKGSTERERGRGKISKMTM